MAAIIRMAEAQNGPSRSLAAPPLPSPPLPLFERLVAQANGFQVVDRGDGDEDL